MLNEDAVPALKTDVNSPHLERLMREISVCTFKEKHLSSVCSLWHYTELDTYIFRLLSLENLTCLKCSLLSDFAKWQQNEVLRSLWRNDPKPWQLPLMFIMLILFLNSNDLKLWKKPTESWNHYRFVSLVVHYSLVSWNTTFSVLFERN